MLIIEDVAAKQFEAVVVRLDSSPAELLPHLAEARDDRVEAELPGSLPDWPPVKPQLPLQVPPELRERPALVLEAETVVALVDTVAGQVGGFTMGAGALSLSAVLLTADTHETILVEEQLQRVQTGEQEVDSHVELPLVDQERPLYVFLHHNVPGAQQNLLQVVCDFDAQP